MIIQQNTLDELLKEVPGAPPEIGGILGGVNGVISTYQVDRGAVPDRKFDHYYPDVIFLNHTIQEWSDKGIEFYGLFHSHFPGGIELSVQDKRYITQIMLAMPKRIVRLFFPIILRDDMIGYRAIRCGKNVCIERDDIIKIL